MCEFVILDIFAPNSVHFKYWFVFVWEEGALNCSSLLLWGYPPPSKSACMFDGVLWIKTTVIMLLLKPLVWWSFPADQVIYPGKTLDIDCFRIGNIGHLFPSDMKKLLQSVEDVCHDMNMTIPLKN